MKAWCVAMTVLAVVLAAAIAAGAAMLFRGGISARVEPSATESAIARRMRNAAIPEPARRARNPLPATREVLASGRAHFADHCATCHGNDGRGDTRLGRGMYPRAPDMRKPATQELTDGELFYIIENGVRLTGMPGWGGGGHEEDSWALVHFIRHLPRLGPDEIAEMERLNPRSAAEWKELQEDDEFLGQGEDRSEERGHAHH